MGMFRNRKSGFTLVELALTLSIAAIGATGVLVAVNKLDDRDRYETTIDRLQVLEKSLQTFVSNYGYLPCPADPTDRFNDADFGKPSTYTAGTCATNEGAVPIRSDNTGLPGLDLDTDFAFDGWNRQFTYRIATSLGSQEDFENDENRGDISIQDINGYELSQLYSTSPLNYGGAYVIVSYGPNGNGGYLKTGSQYTTPTDGKETENTDTDSVYVKNERTSTFDDITVYKRKIDLDKLYIRYAEEDIPDAICHHAKDIVESGELGSGNILDTYMTAGIGNTTEAEQIYETAKDIDELCDNDPEDDCVGVFGPYDDVKQANSTSAGNQFLPEIASLAGGDGFVVTFNAPDASDFGVYARMFDSKGEATTSDIQVNTTTSGYQWRSAVAGSDDGGFVVIWLDESVYKVKARVFDDTGSPTTGEFIVGDLAEHFTAEPVVTSMEDGSFVTVWEFFTNWSFAGSLSNSILASRYTFTGTAVATDFMVNGDGHSDENWKGVTKLSNGNYVITSHAFDYQTSTSENGRTMRIIDGTTNTPLTGIINVNQDRTGSEFFGKVQSFGGENEQIAVVWINSEQDSSNPVILGRFYDTLGYPNGNTFQVNTSAPPKYTRFDVGPLEDDGFFVVWQHDSSDIYLQRYDSSGAAEGSEYVVTAHANSESVPRGDYLSEDRFVVAWTDQNGRDGDGTGVFFRIFYDDAVCP